MHLLKSLPVNLDLLSKANAIQLSYTNIPNVNIPRMDVQCSCVCCVVQVMLTWEGRLQFCLFL